MLATIGCTGTPAEWVWRGIVAKQRDSRYRSGRCREWIKTKNPTHPAIERAMLIAMSKRARR